MKRVLEPMVARCGFLYPSGLDKGFKNPETYIQINDLGKFPLSDLRVFQSRWVGVFTRSCDVLLAGLRKASCEPNCR